MPRVGRALAASIAANAPLAVRAVKRAVEEIAAECLPQDKVDYVKRLKARGYRWNADQRVWHTRLKSDTELNAECEWLADPNL